MSEKDTFYKKYMGSLYDPDYKLPEEAFLKNSELRGGSYSPTEVPSDVSLEQGVGMDLAPKRDFH